MSDDKDDDALNRFIREREEAIRRENAAAERAAGYAQEHRDGGSRNQ